jgi:hypothetical protein
LHGTWRYFANSVHKAKWKRLPDFMPRPMKERSPFHPLKDS